MDSGYAVWAPTGELYTVFPHTARGMKEAQDLVDRLNEDLNLPDYAYTWG